MTRTFTLLPAKRLRLAFCAALVYSLFAVPAESHANEKATRHFETHIRPVLLSKCIKCHGEKKQESGLRLDSRAAILKGGESGPAIVPGKPNDSLLVDALRYEGLEMPPAARLSNRTIANFVRWIADGAVWPDGGSLRADNRSISDDDRDWWAFRPISKTTIPPHGDDWAVNPIDRFVAEKFSQQNFTPAARAERRVLARRAYLTLTGLPPTPEQLDAFLNDSSKTAWPNLIDELLNSPHFGEHQARQWLDLVRYSDSDGWNQDAFRPHIWRYRDYVIRAMNADKPWSDFVREQLAGDEIPSDDPDRWAAAGFLRLGIYEYNQRDARGHWNDIMNEITDVTGDVFFGLSMACARCHDHKFDPILQADYFRLRAVFEPIEWRDDIRAATKQQHADHAKKLKTWQTATADIQAKIDALLKPYHDKKWASTVEKFPLEIQACFHKPVAQRNSWEHQMAYLVSRQFEEEAGGPLKNMSKADKARHEELKKELAAFDKQRPQSLPAVMTVTDFSGDPADTRIPDLPNEEPIAAGTPVVVTSDAEKFVVQPNSLPHGKTTGRRTALANWITRPDNWLTQRVIVNRIWQQAFGTGLVPTTSDFGHNGTPASHPELLDWLVGEFVRNGGRRKPLLRLMLTSATWQQSAKHPNADAYQRRDPGDRLLWRSSIRRLTAEQIRDAMLVASGELDRKTGGASVDEKKPRRAIYVKSFRNKLDTFLHAFDMTAGLKSVPDRNITTTPNQSLLLMNGSFALARAKKLAAELPKSEPEDFAATMYERIWNRKPDPTEMDTARQFLEPDTPSARIDFCHVLLNASEFLYVE